MNDNTGCLYATIRASGRGVDVDREQAHDRAAEGSVRTHKRDGGELRLRFCDVFVMEAGKIRSLTSYLTDFKQDELDSSSRRADTTD